MCHLLGIPRSSYYYQAKDKPSEEYLESAVKEIFSQSRKSYGARKIKKMMEGRGIRLSRRRIRRIMKRLHLVSVYQKRRFKPQSTGKNTALIPNRLKRQFQGQKPLEALVTDLTYVWVQGRWAYVCLMIDLFNREIVGTSTGWQKSADLVRQALYSIPYGLTKVTLFHSDRGKEFDNELIDELLEAFGIKRSLSQAGCPYDNAVAESTYHCFKTEFVSQNTFQDLEELDHMTKSYVYWWNHQRIHGSLDYQTPINIRNNY